MIALGQPPLRTPLMRHPISNRTCNEHPALPPLTIAGLLVKFRVALRLKNITDDAPRADQDWDDQLFNIVGDDVARLADARLQDEWSEP
jgi:hypothetical protein